LVVGRDVAMSQAAMPKTPVHKHGHLGFREDKIWLSEYRLMTSPAGDTVKAKEPDQGEFGFFVAVPANPGHDVGTFGFGEDVRHFASTRGG
jgi:hypothetical protein